MPAASVVSACVWLPGFFGLGVVLKFPEINFVPEILTNVLKFLNKPICCAVMRLQVIASVLEKDA